MSLPPAGGRRTVEQSTNRGGPTRQTKPGCRTRPDLGALAISATNNADKVAKPMTMEDQCCWPPVLRTKSLDTRENLRVNIYVSCITAIMHEL